jgi:transposase
LSDGRIGREADLLFTRMGRECMKRGRRQYFVGIDISKESFDAHCINTKGESLFHLSTTMDRAGFQRLIKKLSSVTDQKRTLLCGMESTACYHVNLYAFLLASDYIVTLINPLLIANFEKLQLRKTKTDKKDALVIAHFLLSNKNAACQNDISSEYADLKDLARQRESLVKHIRAIKNDINRILTITFPELEQTASLFSKSMLRLLCVYPSAHAVRSAKRTKIAKLLIPGSQGKQTEESVDRIRKAAEISIGTSSPTKELILKQKASLVVHLEENLKELTDILIEMCQSQMHENMTIVTSLPGIGNKTAMNFLIEMGGDPSQYQSYKKLIAMAGLDPALYQSGKIVKKKRISKRGNRHLRRVIWIMTTHAIQFNERFKRYFDKRRKDGLPYKKAVLATAHKLVRLLFAMLKNRTVFNTNMH